MTQSRSQHELWLKSFSFFLRIYSTICSESTYSSSLTTIDYLYKRAGISQSVERFTFPISCCLLFSSKTGCEGKQWLICEPCYSWRVAASACHGAQLKLKGELVCLTGFAHKSQTISCIIAYITNADCMLSAQYYELDSFIGDAVITICFNRILMDSTTRTVNGSLKLHQQML